MGEEKEKISGGLDLAKIMGAMKPFGDLASHMSSPPTGNDLTGLSDILSPGGPTLSEETIREIIRDELQKMFAGISLNEAEIRVGATVKDRLAEIGKNLDSYVTAEIKAMKADLKEHLTDMRAEFMKELQTL